MLAWDNQKLTEISVLEQQEENLGLIEAKNIHRIADVKPDLSKIAVNGAKDIP